MRILIVGVGAVGSLFGARLLQAGRDVTFLVRAERAAQIRSDGLRIVGKDDVTLHPALVQADGLRRPYDLVLLCVKGNGLTGAMHDLAPAVGPDTMILPLLNGMDHLKALRARFGDGPVLGGLCYVSGQAEGDGSIRQLADFQSLTFGELSGVTTARVLALEALLGQSGFEATRSETIVQDMWNKWVQLSALGAVTCLFRGTIGEVTAVPGGADLARTILNECAAIAEACGHRPPRAFLTYHTEALTRAGSPLTSSMFRDLNGNGPVEVEFVQAPLLDRGAAHGIDTPMLRAAVATLRVYQNRWTSAEA